MRGAVTIVGVDCATVPSKVGLALAVYEKASLTIQQARVADSGVPVAEQIYSWLRGKSTVLLALDSPLGWPHALGDTLRSHCAGQSIKTNAAALFRRHTDEVVRTKLAKAPLEVGADRIARTAVSTLALLENIGRLAGKSIALAWAPWFGRGIRAIEVYPTGTLRSYERSDFAPTKDTVTSRKKRLLTHMEGSGRVRFGHVVRSRLQNDHILDAAVCAVAAMDFLEGLAIQPAGKLGRELSRKEGRIWVRDPSKQG